MTVFVNSEQLNTVLQVLFDRIAADPAAVTSLSASRLIIRINLSSPEAAVVFNGRKNPPQVTYGATGLRPDLDIQLTADSLHQILLRELRLSQAIAGRQMSVKGPVWKSFVLEDILHSAQAIYPQVLNELDLGIN